MKTELTCIVCPIGCRITVCDGSITGNGCPRGEKYAAEECTAPVRTITTTVKSANGKIIPVKTDKPIPKELIFKCMNIINRLHPAGSDYRIGDVICRNILDTGSNITVTANR